MSSNQSPHRRNDAPDDDGDDFEKFAGDVPNAARMYDYWLGGKDNYAVDRDTADKFSDTVPHIHWIARQNRAFLGRCVEHLAARGISQFLDIGSGLPTRENVHQVARRTDPDARVVYVDHDPIVVLHARALLAGDMFARVGVLKYDVRDTRRLLRDPTLRRLIDFDRPVAVLMVALLHFVEWPVERIREEVTGPLGEACPPGSHLVISHGIAPDPAAQSAAESILGESSSVRSSGGVAARRTREDVAAMFCPPWRIQPPGVVPVQDWTGIEAQPGPAGAPGGDVPGWTPEDRPPGRVPGTQTYAAYSGSIGGALVKGAEQVPVPPDSEDGGPLPLWVAGAVGRIDSAT